MEVTSAALFISIALVVFGICYYYFTTRHRERMALLEQGLPKDHFKGNANYLPLLLTLGIVSLSIALGVFVGNILDNLNLETLGNLAYVICIFLFLGIGLLASYLVLKRIYEQRK